MDDDDVQAGFSKDETFNTGGNDGAVFDHRTHVPLLEDLNKIPIPEIPKTNASNV